MMTVTLRLRQLRKAKGWRQVDLAARFARPVDPNRISRWENGYATPRTETLMELAQILGCSIDCLLSLAPADDVTDPDERSGTPSPAPSPNNGFSADGGSLSTRARTALFRAGIRTSEQVLALGDDLIYVRGIWKRLGSEIVAYAKAHPGEEFPA